MVRESPGVSASITICRTKAISQPQPTRHRPRQLASISGKGEATGIPARRRRSILEAAMRPRVRGTNAAPPHFWMASPRANAMPTPQPNEPIQIPEPDIIRPPTPAESPQPDVPAGLPEPGPDIVHPTPPREIPPSPPQEVPAAKRRAPTLNANAGMERDGGKFRRRAASRSEPAQGARPMG
jgi:hypothetical protein